MKKHIEKLRMLLGRLKSAYAILRDGSPTLTAVFYVGIIFGGLLAATLDEESKLKMNELAQRFAAGIKEQDAETK